jgi:type I restriction enzyme M protein
MTAQLVQASKLINKIASLTGKTGEKWLVTSIRKSLEEDYGYPAKWLDQHLVKTSSLQGSEGEVVASDLLALTFNSDDQVPYFVLLIEEKGKKATEESLRRVMSQCQWLSLGGYTDGTAEGTGFLRRNLYSSKFEFVPDLDICTVKTLNNQLVNERKSDGFTNGLEPLDENIEDVFFQVHCHLRDIDGLHPDDALDELCKLIYAKIYDEELTQRGSPTKFQRWAYSSSEHLGFEIRRLYKSACDYDSRVFRLKIPQYDRSRGVFNTPLRVSSTALHRCVGVLEGYALSQSRADVKGRAFQKVLDRAVRYGMGQFFTPEPVVRLMVKVANPTVSELILDPFCGSAHFLSRSLEKVRSEVLPTDEKLFHEFAFGKLHGIEKSERMVRVAMTDMRLHGDGHSNIRCTDALADFANFPDISPDSFDVILTNPPFGSLLGAETIKRLGHFELAKGRNNVPLEIIGIERCVQFLRSGGRLGIVLPDSILSNKNTAYVRDWIASNLKIRGIISLPVETFSPFGANVKTSILFARKWRAGEKVSHDYAIFMARIDRLGYDAAGRVTSDSDIDAVSDEFVEFISKNGW